MEIRFGAKIIAIGTPPPTQAQDSFSPPTPIALLCQRMLFLHRIRFCL